MTDHNAQVIRGFADLRGTAALATRKRRVRRPLRNAGRAKARAEARLPTLAEAAIRLSSVTSQTDGHTAAAVDAPQPTLSFRTANLMTAAMGFADAVLVSSALQKADPHLSPAMAMLLASGIGMALVMTGKKLGTTLATFDRLRDQSTRWGVAAGLVAVLATIGSAGLTLLRMTSPLAWPLLAVAVPMGSASVTWMAHSPLWLAVARSSRRHHRAATRHRRLHSSVTASIARHDRLTNIAGVRFRSLVGRSIKHAILDGSLRPDDFESHGRILDQLSAHHLLADETSELRRRVEQLSTGVEKSPIQRGSHDERRSAA